MENNIGIRVYDKEGNFSILWQHLSAEEAEANLSEEGQGPLGAILADWSGDWQPSKPDLATASEYRIVSRSGRNA
jgi:hypothetical protein